MEGNDKIQLLVVKDIGANPSVSAGSQITHYSDLTDGEYAVADAHNVVLSASTVLTNDKVAEHGVKIIGRRGTDLVETIMFKADDIVSYNGITDTTAVNTTKYVGYNGSNTEAIEAINDNQYTMRLSFMGRNRGDNMLNEPPFSVNYKSDASATQKEVAFGLAENLCALVNHMDEKIIRGGVINSAAVTATNDFTGDTEVTQDDKWIRVAEAGTSNDAGTYGAGSDTVVAGDFVRIGSVAGGTALTDNVYEVMEVVDSGSVDYKYLRLDRPVQEATGTYAAGTSDIEVIPAASIGSYFGIKVTGQTLTHDPKTAPFFMIDFEIGLDNFGSTVSGTITSLTVPKGDPKQIKDLEWFARGYKGDPYRGDFMHSGFTSEVDSTAMYDQLALKISKRPMVEGIGNDPVVNTELILAIETGFSDNEAPDIVVDVLDALTTQSSGVGV